MSEGLKNAADIFYGASKLLDCTGAARQMYITGLAVVSTRSSHWSFFPTSPLNLQVKIYKKWNLASIFDTIRLWVALISKWVTYLY